MTANRLHGGPLVLPLTRLPVVQVGRIQPAETIRRKFAISRKFLGNRSAASVLPVRPAFRRGNPGAFSMKRPVKEIGFAVVLGIVCAVSQTLAAGKAGGSLQFLDTDHDGTVDINETKTAASAAFDRLDRDHDGKLSKHELKGRLNAKEVAAEDADHDGTLTKDEFTAAAETRFKAANKDGDDTLDARELGSRYGKSLQRLVR
jgi:Ca2+-binding EF-hand superfamily protein